MCISFAFNFHTSISIISHSHSISSHFQFPHIISSCISIAFNFQLIRRILTPKFLHRRSWVPKNRIYDYFTIQIVMSRLMVFCPRMKGSRLKVFGLSSKRAMDKDTVKGLLTGNKGVVFCPCTKGLNSRQVKHLK